MYDYHPHHHPILIRFFLVSEGETIGLPIHHTRAEKANCIIIDCISVSPSRMAERYGTLRKYGTVRSIFRQIVRYACTVRNYC